MSEYSLLVKQGARNYIESHDEKSERIMKDNISILSSEPYPGRGRGDKEAIVIDGTEVFRLHIGRSHTAIYTIDEDDETVRVREVLPIKEAHDRYGWG